MSKHFYKHTVTGIVAELPDTFAAVFRDKLERVTKPEAAKAVSVEENNAAVEAAQNEEAASTAKEPAKATTKKNDSSKEGNN